MNGDESLRDFDEAVNLQADGGDEFVPVRREEGLLFSISSVSVVW